MGGRGTFAAGNPVAYTYKTVDTIDGIKVLRPIDETKSLKLPEEAHSSTGYVLYDKDGIFHQYREYNGNHEVVMEIGYHYEKSLGSGSVLHVHVHNIPGVEHHNTATKYRIFPGDPIYEKYKKLFRGVR
jgi:hypothetical protein